MIEGLSLKSETCSGSGGKGDDNLLYRMLMMQHEGSASACGSSAGSGRVALAKLSGHRSVARIANAFTAAAATLDPPLRPRLVM